MNQRSSAIHEADPDPGNIVALLDSVDGGAYERGQVGIRQSASGETVPLRDL